MEQHGQVVHLSGFTAFVSYASSQVTTLSSNIASSTYTTFSNSPAFTITPTMSGTYKVYCPLTFQLYASTIEWPGSDN